MPGTLTSSRTLPRAEINQIDFFNGSDVRQ